MGANHALPLQIYDEASKMNDRPPSGSNSLISGAHFWHGFPRNFPFLTEQVPGSQESGISFLGFYFECILRVLGVALSEGLWWGSVPCPAHGASMFMTLWNGGAIPTSTA